MTSKKENKLYETMCEVEHDHFQGIQNYITQKCENYSEEEKHDKMKDFYYKLTSKVQDDFVVPALISEKLKSAYHLSNCFTKIKCALGTALTSAVGMAIAVKTGSDLLSFGSMIGAGTAIYTCVSAIKSYVKSKRAKIKNAEIQIDWNMSRDTLVNAMDFCQYNDLKVELDPFEDFAFAGIGDLREDRTTLKGGVADFERFREDAKRRIDDEKFMEYFSEEQDK